MSRHNRAKQIARWFLIGLLTLIIVLVIAREIQIVAESRYDGVRAPYLQNLSSTAVTLRWQDGQELHGVVHYGESPELLQFEAGESEPRMAHEVRLEGLKPDTQYWYASGDEQGMDFGGTAQDWFRTAPQTGSERPVRFWVLGDPGYAGKPGKKYSGEVRDAALAWMRANPREGLPDMDLILTTGDNAYSSGRNEDFQRGLFDVFAHSFANYPVWPVYGNHDDRRRAYFPIFSLPTKGEAGGVASGTEHYYAFDYGLVHFVVLDSQDSSLAPDADMALWLEKDLKANSLPWTVVLFHHPPYTKGSHDSDHWQDSWGRLVQMRENFLPILENHGVDLVLSGHSHVYERSHLLACHYGPSDTLQGTMILSEAGGPEQPFEKTLSREAHSGTVYAVVGSSAKRSKGPLNHPAHAVSLREFGSMIVDIRQDTLQARFVNMDGKIMDHFLIRKTQQAHKSQPCK